jgi:hypothetical protein
MDMADHKPKPLSYDERCEDLAYYFLAESVTDFDKPDDAFGRSKLQRLAAHIQEAIESWLHDLEEP